MVTIKQVAQHAGVSRATVSRVLNEHPRVAPELREKVLEAVRVLNYQPNAVARSLRRQESKTIGLIVSDNRNPFFAEIATGIEEFCYAGGYNVYLCNSADDDDKEIEYCHNLFRQRVAGVIMAITGTTAEGVKYLQSRGMPIVLIDRSYPNITTDSVQCDHYEGGKQALNHLLELGHRKISIVMGQLRHPPVRARLQACIDVLGKYGWQPDPAVRYEAHDYAFETGYRGAKHLLERRPADRPTAIFAFNDTIAIGVLQYAIEHKIDVPGELSIVGVDNIPLSSFVSPRLTTVAQPMMDIGRTAGQILLDRIQGRAVGQVNKFLPTQLIIRESTSKPRE